MGQALIYSTVLLSIAGALLGAVVCWLMLRLAHDRKLKGMRLHFAKLEHRHAESQQTIAGMTSQINALRDEVRTLREGTRPPRDTKQPAPTPRPPPAPLTNPVISAEPERPAQGFQDTQIVDGDW